MSLFLFFFFLSLDRHRFLSNSSPSCWSSSWWWWCCCRLGFWPLLDDVSDVTRYWIFLRGSDQQQQMVTRRMNSDSRLCRFSKGFRCARVVDSIKDSNLFLFFLLSSSSLSSSFASSSSSSSLIVFLVVSLVPWEDRRRPLAFRWAR